jgi:hypothetical protein
MGLSRRGALGGIALGLAVIYVIGLRDERSA